MADMILGAGIKSRFVDCEIMGQRTKTGKGTIVVMDAFDPANPKPYAERMKEIEHSRSRDLRCATQQAPPIRSPSPPQDQFDLGGNELP
jgi:hypothetical protein